MEVNLTCCDFCLEPIRRKPKSKTYNIDIGILQEISISDTNVKSETKVIRNGSYVFCSDKCFLAYFKAFTVKPLPTPKADDFNISIRKKPTIPFESNPGDK